jgi:hypothetical protein
VDYNYRNRDPRSRQGTGDRCFYAAGRFKNHKVSRRKLLD